MAFYTHTLAHTVFIYRICGGIYSVYAVLLCVCVYVCVCLRTVWMIKYGKYSARIWAWAITSARDGPLNRQNDKTHKSHTHTHVQSYTPYAFKSIRYWMWQKQWMKFTLFFISYSFAPTMAELAPQPALSFSYPALTRFYHGALLLINNTFNGIVSLFRQMGERTSGVRTGTGTGTGGGGGGEEALASICHNFIRYDDIQA